MIALSTLLLPRETMPFSRGRRSIRASGFSVGTCVYFRGFLEVNPRADEVVAMGLLLGQEILTSLPMAHYGSLTISPMMP